MLLRSLSALNSLHFLSFFQIQLCGGIRLGWRPLLGNLIKEKNYNGISSEK